MAEATFTFPRDFLWGTATAAHQVEGGNANNDWYLWEQDGGKGHVFQDEVSGAACDWWDGQAEKDVRRMKDLHTNAHRLSIEWSRIEPEPGRWDHDAIDRYRAILEAMRKARIQPMVTLHHFTNPIWLAERGGWLDPEVVRLFERFVRKAVGELADLCTLWCTVNEPTVYGAEGYFQGIAPPGHKDISQYFQVVFHLMDGHAAAYHTIHDLQPQAQVGFAHRMPAWYPRNPTNPLDRMITNLLDRFFNRLVIEPIKTGVWKPLVGRRVAVNHWLHTLDWMGLNYYERFDAWFSLRELQSLGIQYAARPGHPRGPKAWGELYPDGFFDLIMRVWKLLGVPIAITENGVPDPDDSTRPGFILEHLRQLWRAINSNVPVTGYYHWSLMDNFEWYEGYDPRFRFGLYAVDHKTQKRTIKTSGEMYREICSTGTISSDMARRYAPDVLERLFPGEAPPGR